MDFQKKSTPEILISPKNKPIKDVPKRPEEKIPSFMEMSKDELIEYVAVHLLGIPVDPEAYKKDTVYQAKINLMFFKGMIAYVFLGFRDLGFPIEQYMEANKQRLKDIQSKAKILRV